MDAVKFLKEKARMTNCCAIDCKKCPINDLSEQKDSYCSDVEMEYPEEVLEVVEQWSKENPAKTYKDDFLEKFPQAHVNPSGTPKCCRNRVYGLDSCEYKSCSDCWDMEMEE